MIFDLINLKKAQIQSWTSYMSKKLSKKLGLQIPRNRKFTNGLSESIGKDVSRRWGGQRKISNVINELSNIGAKGIFIIGLCRPMMLVVVLT